MGANDQHWGCNILPITKTRCCGAAPGRTERRVWCSQRVRGGGSVGTRSKERRRWGQAPAENFQRDLDQGVLHHIPAVIPPHGAPTPSIGAPPWRSAPISLLRRGTLHREAPAEVARTHVDPNRALSQGQFSGTARGDRCAGAEPPFRRGLTCVGRVTHGLVWPVVACCSSLSAATRSQRFDHSGLGCF